MTDSERPYVQVPRDLLEAIAHRLYIAGDDLYRGQIEALLDAARADAKDQPCPTCVNVTGPSMIVCGYCGRRLQPEHSDQEPR